MKKLLFLISLFFVVTAVMAVPAKPGLWRIITLTDGTSVRAMLAGDEHMHFFVSEAGKRYVQDPTTGFFVEKSSDEVAKIYSSRKAKRAPRRKVLGQIDKTALQGAQKGLIILVEFADKEFAEGHDLNLYHRIANERHFTHELGFKGSVRDYFHDQSHGQFDLTFDVVGPVKLSHEFAYYGANDEHGDDLRPGEMVAEAVLAIQEEVDFSEYDWNGDGIMENFYVLYAGLGEADSSESNSVWPHMWELSSNDYGQAIQLNGVVIDMYACGNEAKEGGDIEGIGTLCHEFSHCMGFPDMYDTHYSGNFGMGYWDLMNSGSYLDGSFTPAGYSAYERWQCGWIEPVELVNDTVIGSMKAINLPEGEAFVIYNKGHRDEYYVLENRQLTGWNAYLPAAGMLVTHVDFDPDLWAYNAVNTTGYVEDLARSNTHQRLTILHADNDDDADYFMSWMGGYWMTTQDGDTYPYSDGRLKRDSITHFSNPADEVYNANTDGSYFMNINIYDITQNDDGSMAFRFLDFSKEPDPQPEPTPLPEGTVFYESFDKCVGKGANDGEGFTGSVAIGNFMPDLEGWASTEEAAYGAFQCARFGSSRRGGEVTSPPFTISGETTLSFRAAPWGNDSTSLQLAIIQDEVNPESQESSESSDYSALSISPSELQMTSGEWTDFTVTLQGEGSVRIVFTPAKRFFLDEVMAVSVSEVVDGISDVSRARQITDNRIFSLDGRCLGTYSSSLPKGIYIVNGRKIMK